MYRMLKTWLSSFISLFFPDCCCACGCLLVRGEVFLCLSCLSRLPVVGSFQHDSHPVEDRIRGRFPYCRFAAFLYFEKGGMAQKLIHRIKYGRGEELGVWCGSRMYDHFHASGLFEGVDLIIPVPLHPGKRRKRGFNQAERMAEGISSLSGIPVDTLHLVKVRKNSSQTKRTRYERWLNSKESFVAIQTDDLAGKHILLLDDVVTTGATLEACANALLVCEDLKISILVCAVSK